MEQLIKTKFTERFGITHPVISAPMNLVSGGRLSAAVSEAGGLGLLGGGYGDGKWLDREFRQAGNSRVGIGMITWSFMQQPHLIEWVIAKKPAAIMVSFGDGEEIIKVAKAENIPTIWQVQTLEKAKQALAANVDIIIAQGQEAGGHAKDRGLMTLLPAVRDMAGPDQIVIAAGGIADGRGLAASLALGADGVMMGTRFYACEEASSPDTAKKILTSTGGDKTVRSGIFDVARGLDWPETYSGRCIENEFSNKWKENISGLKQNAKLEQDRFNSADPEDFTIRPVIAGEALDLISEIKPAKTIIDNTVAEAAEILKKASGYLV
ncbi:MAG: NAD(P)H-dependent flavin oxidoreductase [Methyloligellaceae bacterium]